MQVPCSQCGARTARPYRVAETSMADSTASVSRSYCSLQCYMQRKYELYIYQRCGIDLRSGYVMQKGRISNLVPKGITWLRRYRQHEAKAKKIVFFRSICKNRVAFANAMIFFGDPEAESLKVEMLFEKWAPKLPNVLSMPTTYSDYELKRRQLANALYKRREAAKKTRPEYDDASTIASVDDRFGLFREDALTVPIRVINELEQAADEAAQSRMEEHEMNADVSWADVE